MEICKIDKKIIGWKVSKITKENKNTFEDKRPEKITPALAPKRPKELHCDIHNVSIKGKKWVALIGLLDNDPYEVFAGHSENLSIPTKCSKGKIVKAEKGKYDLHIDISGEDLIIYDIIKTFDNTELAWETRLLSTSLRHGTPVEFIVNQLSKCGFINDANKVISRVLKKYIKEGTKVRTNDVCEKCKSSDLVYSEGCSKCLQCGFSKCN